jgi:Family of unknown function (DUF6152)
MLLTTLGRNNLMRKHSALFAAAAFVLVMGVSSTVALAHHSFAAQYDRSKPATLNGPVTKVDWINPHARFFVDSKDASGKIVNWEVELAAPAMLLRRGWTRNSMKIGEVVTVNGSLAKDGSNLMNATTVTLSDGKKVFAGSSGGDGEGTTP